MEDKPRRRETSIVGHAGVALPAKGYQTRNPKARTCILRGDGREGNGVGQTMSPSEEGVRRPARPRVPRVQSAVETGAFAVLNEDRYALVALTPCCCCYCPRCVLAPHSDSLLQTTLKHLFDSKKAERHQGRFQYRGSSTFGVSFLPISR